MPLVLGAGELPVATIVCVPCPAPETLVAFPAMPEPGFIAMPNVFGPPPIWSRFLYVCPPGEHYTPMSPVSLIRSRTVRLTQQPAQVEEVLLRRRPFG